MGVLYMPFDIKKSGLKAQAGCLDPIVSELAETRRKLTVCENALREARAIIAEQDAQLDFLRLLAGDDRDMRKVAVTGLTRLQALVLAMLADGRAHSWCDLGHGLEVLADSRSEDHEGLIRTIVSKLRAFLRQRGLADAIETHNRTGYRIAPSHLTMVQSLLWPLDSNAAAASSSDPQPERTNHHVEHKQTP